MRTYPFFVSLALQPSVRPRSCPWWRSRVWTVTPPRGAREFSSAATTSCQTPRWCLWRRPKVSSRRLQCHLSHPLSFSSLSLSPTLSMVFPALFFSLFFCPSLPPRPSLPRSVPLVSPPVKIVPVLPASHMWCALRHYIFNQNLFTFAEISIACSLTLAASEGMNHKRGMCNLSLLLSLALFLSHSFSLFLPHSFFLSLSLSLSLAFSHSHTHKLPPSTLLQSHLPAPLLLTFSPSLHTLSPLAISLPPSLSSFYPPLHLPLSLIIRLLHSLLRDPLHFVFSLLCPVCLSGWE